MKNNSFDFVRVMAAIGVIFSHSFALVGKPEPHIGNINLGGFCVWVFFIISGYLISYSWKSYPRFNVYMYKRMLRIFPALIVAVILSIISLGLISKLSYHDYILSQVTRDYMNNILLINTQYSLPGVFENNPYPGAVNGSIWTLSYEFLMYVLVAVLGSMLLLNRKGVLRIWLLLLLISLLPLINIDLSSVGTILYFNPGLVFQMGLMFFSGVLFQTYDKNINYKYWPITILVFFSISYLAPALTTIVAGLLLAYSVIGFCKTGVFSGISKFGDVSYGVYIYAFIIQQTVQHFIPTNNPYKLFIYSTLISIVFGFLSWHFVEKRFIKLKSRINKKSYPITDRHSTMERAW